MELKISKDQLSWAVNASLKAVPSKSNMPIMECILITAQDDEICFTANNTELGVEAYPQGEVVEGGCVALDAKMFAPVVSKLPDGDISLKTNGESVLVKCGRSKFTLAGRDGSEFPIIDTIERENKIMLGQSELKDVIKQTVFCTAQNENNRIMTGSLFQIDGDKLKVIALDGHRIAVREITLDKSYPSVKAIIPAKTLQEVMKLLSDGDVDLYVTDSLIAFSFDNTLVTSRLIDGEFFDIDRLMHYDFNTEIKVDRQELLACVDRATLLVKEIDRKPVVFTIGDTMKAEIVTQLGSMSEEIEIETTGEGLVVGLNPRFLIDVMRVLDDEKVSMFFVNAKSPCYIKGEGYIYVVLPIQLRESL